VSDEQLHTEGQDAPQYPVSWDGLKQALAALGDTADEIAASLQAQGIKGAREDNRSCPVARYLEKVFPGWEPDVQGREVILAHGHEVGIEVDVEPIGAFVQAFDDEGYPDLDESPREDEGDEPGGYWGV
jgi:hypothetical protein